MRTVIVLLVGVPALLASGAAMAQAGAYPSKPIRVIVTFAAGGPTDITARAIAQDITGALGQTVVIDNRSGANGQIGTVLAAKAAADGYTLLYNSLNHTVNSILMPNPGYDPIRDFAPVSLMTQNASLLVVGPSQPYGSVADLLKAARAKPGTISFGSAGHGGSAHLTAELMRTQAGVAMTHVPFRGNAPALTEVIGGQVTFIFLPLSGVSEMLATKRVKAIGITTASRIAQYPDVPTMKELGYTGFEESHPWSGMLAPAGTPSVVISRLHAALMQSAASGTLRKRAEQTGTTLVGSTPQEFSAFLVRDAERWRRVIQAAGIKPE